MRFTAHWTSLIAAVILLVPAPAQSQASSGVSASSSSTTSSPSSAQNVSVVLTTQPVTVTTLSRSGDQNVPITTVIPVVFNVTITPTPTSASASATASSSTSPSPAPIVLATKLDPGFAVLGALLILTGLPSAFWGHKNRWTSFFLIGFYTLSLVCIVLILKFGVLPAVNPPGKTLRGMFVLSSTIAGVAGGGVAIFFWKGAKYFIGAWGGFAFALWIECFRDGGLIHSSGLKWILYIACAAIGFVLCTIPKIHYHVLLVSTAMVGASSFMLGVDCYTTAGLKEFYIWNLGFRDLFPKFTNNHIEFPVSQSMQIELGLLCAVALMGCATQFRILKVLQLKLKEIKEEQRKRDEEAEIDAAERFATVIKERDGWEREHPTLNKLGKPQHSGFSTPLMKDHDGFASRSNEDLTLTNNGRPRSGVSDFFAAPTPDDELKRAARGGTRRASSQLPALDLGLGIKDDVPKNFIAKDVGVSEEALTIAELEDRKRKAELMTEILTIRKSIEALKSDTSSPPPERPERRRRHSSLTSRLPLNMDAGGPSQPAPSHTRPPREHDPRSRSVHSPDYSSRGNTPPASRRNSTTLEHDWDAYVQDRKLLQPPAGITPPILTTSSNPRISVPPAVAEALIDRKRRESALSRRQSSSSDDIPLAKIQRQSTMNNAPVTILPPRRSPSPKPGASAPQPSRVRTFEELNERHREKLRDMQAPLSQAEKDHFDLEAAKSRWSRSKAIEKEAVTKRQAEKAAQVAKDQGKKQQQRSGDESPNERVGRRASADPRQKQKRHSRSLSADKLNSKSLSTDKLNAGNGMGSRRLSTLKVEDWQRFQRDSGTLDPVSAPDRNSRRQSNRPDAPDRQSRTLGGGSRLPPS